jgi:serine/threonine-protein kinase
MRAMAAPAHTDGSPEDLLNDRYRLHEIVGEGGMAVVWRAYDQLLERDVAVKILREQYAADPDFLERFRSEARAAASLNDPGVVAVYDVGEDRGRHYLVMEYVPGSDLKAVIREQAPLSPKRAVEIGAAVAHAVSAAHEHGMVHRDVKPQNVLISPDGRMKVADFGIARAVAATGTTAPGVVLGTVHYISPEQAAGQPALPTSDVYSLGVLLYEMLTGKLPHDADSSVGVAMKIMNEDPEPIEVVNPSVPSVLAGIVARAMARDPQERYQDAGALAEALDSYARWSDQQTGVVGGAAGAAGAGVGAVRSSTGAATLPPPRPAEAQDQDVPLLDRTGLLLGLVALLALAGLIPLWSAVRDRLQPGESPLGFLSRQVVVVEPGEEAQLLPTPEPTVVIVIVPAVTGLSESDATERLEREGLGVTSSLEQSDSAPPGQVIRQIPEPGTSVPTDHVVELIVSGEPSVVVPQVSGDWATVAQTLEQYGFVPVQRYQWAGAGSPTVGQVIDLNPPPGNKWRRGAPVYVTVDGGSWLPLGVDFDDNIHLSGIELPTAEVAPGQQLSFVAHWEATDTSEFNGEGAAPAGRADYVMRATLEGPDGQTVASDEHVPVGGSRPTSTWQPGESITNDVYVLNIAPDAPPGNYTLWIDVHPVSEPDSLLSILQSASRVAFGDRVRAMRGIVVGVPGAEGAEGAGGAGG